MEHTVSVQVDVRKTIPQDGHNGVQPHSMPWSAPGQRLILRWHFLNYVLHRIWKKIPVSYAIIVTTRSDVTFRYAASNVFLKVYFMYYTSSKYCLERTRAWAKRNKVRLCILTYFVKYKLFEPITTSLELLTVRKRGVAGLFLFFFWCFRRQQRKRAWLLECVLMACEGLHILEKNKLVLSSCVILQSSFWSLWPVEIFPMFYKEQGINYPLWDLQDMSWDVKRKPSS